MKTVDAASGRWREIMQALGIEVGRNHGPCPANGQGDDRFRFADRNGSGNYFCACSDGSKGGIGLVMCVKACEYKEAARMVDEVIGNSIDEADKKPPKPSYASQLRPHAIKSTRSAYLASRGLTVAPGLEWHKGVRYSSEDKTLYAAMLAPIYRAGQFLTYHVTYLQDGAKAPLDPARKILPGPENRGGACPLYPPAETMGVAEGVETAIAASMLHGGLPVWAALNTALLKSFDPPPECKHLMIFGDNDANFAGHAAAYALAHRLQGKLESVTVFFPTKVGTDWNDVLIGGEA